MLINLYIRLYYYKENCIKYCNEYSIKQFYIHIT